MAASLLLSCGLNEPQLPQFTFLREDAGVDGSFLITCIVGTRLRLQNTTTILVCTHNTKEHYVTAGMRLGFNVTTAIDKGALVVIEPLANVAANLFTSPYLRNAPDQMLHQLCAEIESHIKVAFDQHGKSTVTVVVDDLSALYNFGATESMLLRFVAHLLQMNDKLSVCMKLNTSNLFESLVNNLETMAEAEIQIVRLASGNFKEVDGKLVSIRRDPYNTTLSLAKSMLYKVNERNIKIFAPGEVGIKIN